MFCILIVIIGCSSAPIEKAFNGEFANVRNNRVIYDYCQSCHIHNTLNPSSHVMEKSELYQSNEFRKSKECRTCHYIEKSFWGDVIRKTIRPEDNST